MTVMSEYVLGKIIGASIGFVLISLILIPTTLKEGVIRFAFFIGSVILFTSPVLNYIDHGAGLMQVASAAGIAGISAWILAAVVQVISGYTLTEMAEIAAIVRKGKCKKNKK